MSAAIRGSFPWERDIIKGIFKANDHRVGLSGLCAPGIFPTNAVANFIGARMASDQKSK